MSPWGIINLVNRKIIFSIDEYYHIYNRGNDKREIFLDDFDRDRFVKLLYLCNSFNPVVIKELPQGDTLGVDRGSSTLVDIGAYCLMPNHFHLLVREREEGGITSFMKKLSTGYSMYFNIKNKRTGKLFEGVFKAVHVDDDQYLKYLFAYIHLNPVKLIDTDWKENGIRDKNRAINFLNTYKYSSYLDHTGYQRPEVKILNPDNFPGYFEENKSFEEYLTDWLTFPR